MACYNYSDNQVLGMLHQILRPFLLRRLKEDVERNIPPKKEIILYVKMTDHQKHFNDHLISKTLEDYLHKTSEAPSSVLCFFSLLVNLADFVFLHSLISSYVKGQTE